MLKLWGNADSVNVQKVMWCCEEMGVAYERIDAGKHFGVVNTPEFLAMNPNGLVPTIDDDGFVVWESNTIIRYLTAKHAAGTLWPTDVVARANADRWMDWANSTLWPTMVPLFRAIMRTPPALQDPAVIEKARLESFEVLSLLDAHLAVQAYIGGEDFTMADIVMGCGVWRWMALPIERPPLPHLQRWFDLLAARPAYRKVVMTPLL
ncbi:MAG: glutathione S-transferase family protein [Burkholderiales bacterium]|nr:glutathione S-transferase family protein [Burkholderiales bacterium]